MNEIKITFIKTAKLKQGLFSSRRNKWVKL